MPLEGSNSAILDPGLVLIGPNSANKTCMENGEWEPDPKSIDVTLAILAIIVS